MTAILPPEERPVIVRDVHPARVTGPDGTAWDRAKAVLTQARLYVYTEDGRAPTLTYTAPFDRDGLYLPPRGASQGKAWRVPTPDGLVVVQPSGGCGCGSLLKLHRPFVPEVRGDLE